jgi:hypothetical protein
VGGVHGESVTALVFVCFLFCFVLGGQTGESGLE